MNQYEVVYVIDNTLEDQARNDLIARFSSLVVQNGGNVDRVDEWGKRRLAYAINYKTEGYYVLMYVTAPPDLPRELERNLQISESVLRYLVIRFEGALPPKREPLKAFAPPAPSAAPAAPVEEKPAEEKPAEAEEAKAAPVEEASAEAAAPAVEAAPAAEAEAPAEPETAE